MVKFIFTLLVTFLISVFAHAQNADTIQQVVPGRQNSLAQQAKPYVILISVDGMRYDYAKKYNARHLLALSAQGVKAKAMLPSYPSITFPNHYTLITGLYPAHTGLVCNRFTTDGLMLPTRLSLSPQPKPVGMVVRHCGYWPKSKKW